MTHIHWLRLTDHNPNVDHTFSARLASHFGSSKPHPPFYGYKMAFEYAQGVTMHTSPDREDMGRMWDFTGTACDNLGMETMSILLRWASEYGCTSSRIDLAHDFFGGEVTVNDIATDWYKGIENGTARKRKEKWVDGAISNEFNLGVRSSDLYCRCYDKGMEMNLDEFKKGDWTRVEFEIKGHMSRAAILEYSVMRHMNIGEFCNSLWLGLANGFFAAATLNRKPFQWGIMPTYLRLPKRINSTQYWLENQVTQGICNFALSLDNGDDWLASYLQYVIDTYQHRKANQK